MSGVENQPPEVQSGKAGAVVGVVILMLLLGVAGYMLIDLRGRVSALEASAERQRARTEAIEARLHGTSRSMEQGMRTLGSQVGTAQKELSRRTAELKKQQERSSAKLTAEQQATRRELVNVNTEMSGVKSRLGGAQTDIASTRSDLEATKAKLETAIGDLNLHSGMIAKNHDELEYLKHRGGRNYYEFTLRKKHRTPISTVSLELKKTNPKKSRFTLNVYADDHTIEKKDRTLGEPLQFYTGRDRKLYEIVVFNETKNDITGYLATPK